MLMSIDKRLDICDCVVKTILEQQEADSHAGAQ